MTFFQFVVRILSVAHLIKVPTFCVHSQQYDFSDLDWRSQIELCRSWYDKQGLRHVIEDPQIGIWSSEPVSLKVLMMLKLDGEGHYNHRNALDNALFAAQRAPELFHDATDDEGKQIAEYRLPTHDWPTYENGRLVAG